MAKVRPGKAKAVKGRNPVARKLSEGRYRPREEQPRKGKGSYRRQKAEEADKS